MKFQKGQFLIEILVAMAIAAILLPALINGIVTSREGRVQSEQRIRAAQLMREAVEAVRVIRQSGWSNVSTNGNYRINILGTTWSLIPGSETLDGYTRTVNIANSFRNSNGDLVGSGGAIDPSTKAVTVTVSWTSPTPSNVSTTVYLTRYLDNIAYIQSSQAEYLTGTNSNLQITNISGGELQLGLNTKAKWCGPTLSTQTIDLPGKPNRIYAQEGHIYVSTGQVAQSGEESFAHVLVSNTDPPVFTLNGRLRNYKTNGVFGEGNSWGYLATTDNGKEAVIVNLGSYSDPVNKIFTEQGYFNTPSSSLDANAIYVLNNRGYLTAGNYLYVFDLSSKSGSRPQIGSRIQFANSGDRAREIYVRTVGNSTYAFIAIIGSTVEEMKIANVTNHNNSSTWRIISGINIEPNNCSTLESGQSVFVKPDGSRAYISSVNDAAFKEFFVLDTSNKSSPSLIGGFANNPPCTDGGGYEAGGLNPEQSAVVSLAENRALLVGTDDPNDAINSEEYQVLDLGNESSPSRCGGFQYDTGLYGVAGVKESDGDTYAYLITGDPVNELKIVQGGPDGLYVESGVYESQIYDVGYNTAFNRISATSATPSGTQIQYQIAIAEAVGGSCTNANYVYVGPDGTSGTYFPVQGGKISFDDDDAGYENPGRCLRYKAYLSTTDYNQTPVLYDVTVNMSP